MNRFESLGVDEGKVRLTKFDDKWMQLYRLEAERIIEVCKGKIVDITHIGSTAIPGIVAKPIIDIMIGVATMTDGEACIPLLESINYVYKGEYGIPGRLFFVGLEQEMSCYHLHLVVRQTEFWDTHVLFRDYLITHTDIARQYEDLKKELSLKFADNRDEYTKGKHDFIQAVLQQARSEEKK